VTNLLSRHAEAIFWMGRQIERAEDLARILEVNESFSRDAAGAQNWLSVLRLYADEARYFKHHTEVSADSVLHFYVLDSENGNSILSTLHQARENARQIRPLISTELWHQINVFFSDVKKIDRADLSEETLSRICNFVREACQTCSGITYSSFYRDEGWHFHLLGTHIERIDQTTRLLDVKYELLLPSVHDVGSPLDLSQWGALLRSAAGFHAYRRVHPSGMSAERVAGFLLLNDRFPRSVAAGIAEATAILDHLRGSYDLSSGAEANDRLHNLLRWSQKNTIEQIVALGLHETLDWIQRELIAITNDLGVSFFGHQRPRAS
jgi:uncharacterized alpha-E superfamily protein